MRRPNELRDLDEWIGTHLFDLHEFEPNSVNNCICDSCGKDNSFSGHFRADWAHISGSLPRYTTSPAAAIMVLEKCARLLREQDNEETVSIGCDDPYWVVEKTNCIPNLRVEAATLSEAICRFAKNLFEK